MDDIIKQLEVIEVKNKYLPRTRVRLAKMVDSPAPPIGTEGTVVMVDDIGSIIVIWDTGDESVIYNEDIIEILTKPETITGLFSF